MRTVNVLEMVVDRVKCKLGWSFILQYQEPPDQMLELIIYVDVQDSRTKEHEKWTIANHFPVPEATYNYKTWRRWVFDCCVKVEVHELGEWFTDGDERPFAPCHGPGEDPYTLHEYRPEEDALKNQEGVIERPEPMEVPRPPAGIDESSSR